MEWKRWLVSRRVALLQWLLPLLIIVWVVIYQTVLVPFVHNTWGPHWHRAMEVLLYGLVGPLVTFFVLAWIQRWLVEKERAERTVREQEQRLTLVREEEGRRTAQHLHREVLPNFAYVANKLDHIRTRLLQDPAQADQELEKVEDLLREATGELRDKINTLRKGLPLRSLNTESNFLSEVRRRTAEFGKLHQVTVSVQVQGKESPLPYHVETSLWRILGEALNNVALHAQAQHIRLILDLSDPERVTLSVADDGRGFNPQAWRANPKGLGLIHMHEEADLSGGSLAVESAPGRGTRITATLPLQREEALS